MNRIDHQTESTVISRMAPGLVGFLHGFVLGASIPLLPLYLKEIQGFSWTVTGIILTAIPFSLFVGFVSVRALTHVGVDARSGLAVSHLLAAGVAMAVAFRVELPVQVSADWLPVFALAILYFSLLSPAIAWIGRFGDATTTSGQSTVRSLRVWGTVGFIVPAWLCESVLIRFSELEAAVRSYEILFQIVAWSGLAAALSAILLPDGDSSASARADPYGPQGEMTAGRLGIGLASSLVLMVLVQRCHYVWSAPFFAAMIEPFNPSSPIVYRLLVADQIVELFGLLLLGAGLLKFGTRAILIIGALAWSGRSLLLAGISHGEHSIHLKMFSLGAAQILQGVAIVAYFGTLGVILRLHHRSDGCSSQIMLVAVTGVLAMLVGGCAADAFLDRELIAPVHGPLRSLEISGGESSSVDVWYHGWAGVWYLSAVPGLLAVALVGFSKPAGGALDDN